MILPNIWKVVSYYFSTISLHYQRRSATFNAISIYFFSTDVSLQNAITIKSYSYTNLLLGYGINKEVTVSIFWCIKSKEYKMIFNGGNTAINAHTIMREQLQAHLNRHHNLLHIAQIISETYQPLSSLAKLPIIPQLGIPVQDLFAQFSFVRHQLTVNYVLSR